MGVNLSVMHRKLQTQMQVRWRSQPTTQNWIQFPVSCGRDGGGTELKTQKIHVVFLFFVFQYYKVLARDSISAAAHTDMYKNALYNM